jgi:hypothetical protein
LFCGAPPERGGAEPILKDVQFSLRQAEKTIRTA